MDNQADQAEPSRLALEAAVQIEISNACSPTGSITTRAMAMIIQAFMTKYKENN